MPLKVLIDPFIFILYSTWGQDTFCSRHFLISIWNIFNEVNFPFTLLLQVLPLWRDAQALPLGKCVGQARRRAPTWRGPRSIYGSSTTDLKRRIPFANSRLTFWIQVPSVTIVYVEFWRYLDQQHQIIHSLWLSGLQASEHDSLGSTTEGNQIALQ